MSRKLGAVVLAAVIAGVVILTRPGDGRTAYVQRNQEILASLPVFPGAVKARETSARHDQPNCGPSGYGTIVEYRVRPGTHGAAVVNFYASRLARRGWHVDIQSSRDVGAGVGPPTTIGKTVRGTFERGAGRVDLTTDDMTVLTDRPLRAQHIRWRYELVVDYRGRLVRCSED